MYELTQALVMAIAAGKYHLKFISEKMIRLHFFPTAGFMAVTVYLSSGKTNIKFAGPSDDAVGHIVLHNKEYFNGLHKTISAELTKVDQSYLGEASAALRSLTSPSIIGRVSRWWRLCD